MKYILRYLLAMIMATAASGAMAMKSTGTNRAVLSTNYADDVNSEDTFTANTVEGVEMKFRVIDADARICEVATNAIDDATAGEVTIPQEANGYTVKYIGEEAFYACKEITSVIIPNTMVSIGYAAFWSCYSLTSVTIPNTVTSIADEAFAWDSALASIHIPSSVTSIGEWAFLGCSGVKTIVVDEDNEYYSSEDNVLFDKAKTLIMLCAASIQGHYTIPNYVTSIGEAAFFMCTGLTSVTIPNSVISIGMAAFNNCEGLTSINIPNSVTEIALVAFEECYNLSSVIIPNSVTNIGIGAFRNCKKLQDIYSFNPVSPTCEAKVFDGVETATARVHVPEGARENYTLADGWRDFLNILEDAEATGVSAVALDTHASEYYDLSGRKLNSVNAGLRIMREKNGSRKQLVR